MRRVASLAVSLAIVGGLAAAQPAAATSTKTMSGTIDGSDGRAVNALIGFDIHDKNGRKIDMNGKAAYSAYKVINPTLPSTGGSKAGPDHHLDPQRHPGQRGLRLHRGLPEAEAPE